MYCYRKTPATLKASSKNRPCHGNNTDLQYTDGDTKWDEEQLEQLILMIEQRAVSTSSPCFSVEDAQQYLETGGITFVEQLLQNPTNVSRNKRALRRTLHLFQTMKTRMQTLLDQLVTLDALEKKQ